MECHSIEGKLSAYIENQLSSEEKMQIDEHLKTCSKCSLSLEDLKKTIAYAQGLAEIEPPPWLTQKVMAKVREEAEQKKGILQKLFYPLHIKVPVQVIATIAIAVTTIYVFKTIQPEMKLAETPSEQVIVSEQKEKEIASIKDETLAYKEVLSRAPEPVKKRRLEKEPEVLVGKTETEEAPAALAGEKTIPQEADKFSDMGVRKEDRRRAPELKKYAFMKGIKEEIVLTLYVKDVENNAKKTEEIVKMLGGKIVKTESFENKDILIAELNSEKLKELNEKLKLIGEVKEKAVVLESLKVDAARFRGKVKIRIEIVKELM